MRKVLEAKLRSLGADKKGATMVEYAILVALIAVVSIAVVGSLGENIFTAFKQTNAGLTGNQAAGTGVTTTAPKAGG
jgi:Flp pilus assembly pilin Flp